MWGSVVAGLFVAFLAFSAFGCSLDRRGLGGDAALASDATDDVPVPSRDAAEEADTGRDAELDAGDDAGVDAGSMDAGWDAGSDGGMDGGVMDAGWDAGRDGGMDGGRDGGLVHLPTPRPARSATPNADLPVAAAESTQCPTRGIRSSDERGARMGDPTARRQ
jgi:hypothetical protein